MMTDTILYDSGKQFRYHDEACLEMSSHATCI